MSTIKKYFMGSIWFTLISIGLVFWYAMQKTGNTTVAVQFIALILILGVLEISLSFDNAVVNAKVLKTMDEKWRHRFVTWGMIIAVFGMRVIFPIAIICITGHMNPVEAINLALNDQDKYAAILSEAHISIAGFGGSFLLLVALSFFFDVEKEVHWVHTIEDYLSKIGAVKSAEIIFTLLAVSFITMALPEKEQLTFLMSGVFGVAVHEMVKGLGGLLESDEDEESNSTGQSATVAVAKAGLASFIYLEVLDASFSLDGVIGALVISRDIVVIALGLGIGAMAVRSLTLMFVDKGTLSEYKYLEHGAFWAILSLAIIMFVSTKIHIPEIVTGGLAAVLIGGSFIGSIMSNKAEENEEIEEQV
jgi:uncharacterized protein